MLPAFMYWHTHLAMDGQIVYGAFATILVNDLCP
jgi:hypothetical protein